MTAHRDFTPGPWEDGNEAIKVMADRQKPWNGTVFQSGVEDQAAALVALTFGATVEECTAIARLIAAAPELLSKLKAVIDIICDARANEDVDCSTSAGGYLLGDVMNDAFYAASAAIAKAEGRS